MFGNNSGSRAILERKGLEQWRPQRGFVEVTERWSVVGAGEQFERTNSMLHEVSFLHQGAGGSAGSVVPSRGGAGDAARLKDAPWAGAQGTPLIMLDEDHPIMQFLERIGLPQYAEALIKSGFDDMETLMEIQDLDMKDIGIPRGHAVKLRKRLRELLDDDGDECPAPYAQPRALRDIGEDMYDQHEPSFCQQQHLQHQHGHPTSQRQQPRQPRQLAQKPTPQLPPTVQRLGTAPISPRCMEPTDKMKTSVEKSWEKLQRLGCEYLGELLYRDFFEHVPEAMDLFPPEVLSKYREWYDADPAGQDLLSSPALRKIWAKVFVAVGTAVAGLHDLDKLVPRLKELGARHTMYGAHEGHLGVVSKGLIRVLKSCLGDDFTVDVEFAWTMVYSFISAIMMSGMQSASSAPGLRQTSLRPAGPSQASLPPSAGAAPAPVPARRPDITVGYEIEGGNEVYYIERHLQNAIFGDVFEATGLTSGRSFAVKVLDQDMISRFAKLQQDHQFCESPLCEVRFAEVMSGLDNVVQLEDHFADEFYHYVVSELASHGDLLEALRQTPGGFDEDQAQMLVLGAAQGIAQLHERGLAMQDVSLENLLLHVFDDGQWQVRICDPGQAVAFSLDPATGREAKVPFRGFVAKDFRPPELYAQTEYFATKVDSWCLGWSTFYLLCAQPLFNSAEDDSKDADWKLFSARRYPELFRRKGWRSTMSRDAEDFVLRLLDVDPVRRMSVADALRHPWLALGT
mmetsp:Transcript_62873/g.182386  ORF Transcript_62873/g.182386 Transcript_62873/m.182386 type:complete len:740 (+) Transcript_62873:64-2283(+)